MTRQAQIVARHKAMIRRAGARVEIDQDEGRLMAEALNAGESLEAIAERHAVSKIKVQRRLYSMGLYKLLRTGVGA